MYTHLNITNKADPMESSMVLKNILKYCKCMCYHFISLSCQKRISISWRRMQNTKTYSSFGSSGYKSFEKFEPNI